MPKQSKMTACKTCGTEIAANAKTCPKCGAKNKKPIYKRPWFIVLMVLLALGIIGSIGKDSSTQEPAPDSQPVSAASSASATISDTISEETSEPEESVSDISYTAYTVSQLMDDLDANALKAAETYKDQYVELTGRLNVIDSSGKYISIVPVDEEFAIMGVQCYIQSEEQKAVVMEMSMDNTIIVKGKITSVGEVMGYSLDIDEITSAG